MSFRSVALLQSHQRMPPVHDYYVPDLVELCGLAAVIRDQVSELAIPLAPTDRAPFATFERFMRRQRPQLVGISSFTAGARSALGYAAIAHRYGAFVALGGYHPSAVPDEVLASDVVDAVVRGQGELTLAELVRTGSPEQVAGLSYRDDGRIVHNPDRSEVPALDDLPLPLRELRPERFGRRGLDYHTDTIYGSRGCRGRCTFCANHLIVGHERETASDILAYPEYALAAGTQLHNTTFFVMTPYPGTDLAADYSSKDLIESRDWDLYSNFGAVVAPAGLSSWQLQVLHAAVALRYGAARRFLAGKPASAAIAKVFEPLFVLISVGLARGDRSPTEVTAAIGAALGHATATFRRPPRDRRRLADRIAVVFHAGTGSDHAIAVVRDLARVASAVATMALFHARASRSAARRAGSPAPPPDS